MSTDLPIVDETCKLAILELLHFAKLEPGRYHLFYLRFSRMSVVRLRFLPAEATFPNSLLQLTWGGGGRTSRSTQTYTHFLHQYLHNLHPYNPFCHVQTFEPQRTSGFLLGSMLAVGAQFSNISGCVNVDAH